MNARLAATLLTLTVSLVGAGCTARRSAPPSSQTITVAEKTATPLPSATPSPRVSPTPAATTAPTSAPATPSPTATPLPSVPRLSPDSRPKILAVNISSQEVHPGDVVHGTVVTSSNVASVEAHLATYQIPMRKIGVGKFALTYQVPDVPFFFRGRSYPIDIIAHNPRGDTVTTSVPVMVR